MVLDLKVLDVGTGSSFISFRMGSFRFCKLPVQPFNLDDTGASPTVSSAIVPSPCLSLYDQAVSGSGSSQQAMDISHLLADVTVRRYLHEASRY